MTIRRGSTSVLHILIHPHFYTLSVCEESGGFVDLFSFEQQLFFRQLFCVNIVRFKLSKYLTCLLIWLTRALRVIRLSVRSYCLLHHRAYRTTWRWIKKRQKTSKLRIFSIHPSFIAYSRLSTITSLNHENIEIGRKNRCRFIQSSPV